MSSTTLIDAQFDRAVEIVQGLPKTGPIQTDYEEKLAMYSLYKQATIGNVTSTRPGVWDMLNRAKWDAWAKHKDMDPYEAKWLYVEALLKVLRKYSDKTIARNLVQELESYNGDPSNIVMSRSSLSRSPDSSSDSEASEEEGQGSTFIHTNQLQSPQQQRMLRPEDTASSSEEDDSECEDEPQELLRPLDPSISQVHRPQSSLSSQHHYRTPMAGSLAMTPPAHPTTIQAVHGVPVVQPHPGYETPSAFVEPSPASIPSSLYPPGSSFANFSELSRGELTSPPVGLFPGRPYPQPQSLPMGQYGVVRPASTITMQRALESVQSQLAAVTERLEVLESVSHISRSPGGSHTPSWGSGQIGSSNQGPVWDLDDMGMWSVVLNPLSRVIERLREFARFFAKNENRSPGMIVVRRLCLDVSFWLFTVVFVRLLWKKSRERRREVNTALALLWRALLGRKERTLVDRAV